jgi:hypothetical protein
MLNVISTVVLAVVFLVPMGALLWRAHPALLVAALAAIAASVVIKTVAGARR